MGELLWSDYVGIGLVIIILLSVVNDYRTGKLIWPRLRVIKSPKSQHHIPFG